MKKYVYLVIVMVLVLFSVNQAEARTHHIIINNNTTVVDQNTNDHESFDYGAYLDLVFLETQKTEWGTKMTWLQESQEGRIYLGGKVYLNRFFKKKTE